MLIKDLSDEDLLKEWQTWDDKIIGAKSWGAAVGAALEFRQECEREMSRRNIPNPVTGKVLHAIRRQL
jgi:hypothetical protein